VTTSADRTEPLETLCDAITGAQSDDPFAQVTVVVPSSFARVQLRRAVGGRQGICNVAFRTWAELVNDLARAEVGAEAVLRVPSPRMVNESLRQVLLATRSPFASFARSPIARAELTTLLYELWRSNPSLLARLVRLGGRAAALVSTLEALDAHLADHGFTDPARLLERAAAAPVDPRVLGAVLRWFPRPARSRDLEVLVHLGDLGVPVTTIDTGGTLIGSIDTIIACSDPDAEVRVASRQLIGALDDGVALWRQAIIHPPSDRYRRIVHQQLAAAAIATSGASPMTLSRSATGRALGGLLELAGGQWRRADVMRWLGTAPVTAGPGGPRVPANRWDEVSARAGVVEGLDQWRTRLARFATIGPSTDPYVAHTEPEASAALHLAEFIEQLADALAPPSGPWSEWANWALRLLDLYLATDDRETDWPTPELVAARLVREAVGELGELDAVAPHSDLASFRQAVEEELNERTVRDDGEVATPSSEGDADPVLYARVGLPGPVGTGVFVGSAFEARGLLFDRVYVIGMADQFLPGSAQGSTLVPEADVEDEEWPTRERRAQELLEDLKAVLALANRPAIATWPMVDPRNGREHGRSRWIDATGELGEPRAGRVPSFKADIVGEAAASLPLSAGDRLLGALARAVASGTRVEEHPAVAESDAHSGRVPPLRHSVEAARAPSQPVFSRFEGNVGAALAPGVFGELYATRLEQYADCPRHYLFERELGLRVPLRPEATEQMEARDRGTLLHEILATYVSERIHEARPASLDRLLEIAERQFARANDEGRCGPPLMAGVERANLLRDLRRFYEEDTFEPVAAELGFGSMARDDIADDRLPNPSALGDGRARVEAVQIDLPDGRTLRFGGKVDRIDHGPNGSIVVSDYKTGRQEPLGQLIKDPVAGGTRLQLPIYALAAKAYLRTDRPVLARYWLTSWERAHDSLVCELGDPVLERLREVLSTITNGIEAGAFPGVPGEETYRYRRPTFESCIHCDFDRVCPTDRDRRWALVRDAPENQPIIALSTPPEGLNGVVRDARLDLSGLEE
jgi:RecB family exonuclease